MLLVIGSKEKAGFLSLRAVFEVRGTKGIIWITADCGFYCSLMSFDWGSAISIITDATVLNTEFYQVINKRLLEPPLVVQWFPLQGAQVQSPGQGPKNLMPQLKIKNKRLPIYITGYFCCNCPEFLGSPFSILFPISAALASNS